MVQIANMPGDDGKFQADPRVVQKDNDERSDKQEATALDILKAVIPAFQAKYDGSIRDTATGEEAGRALAAMAEVAWRWTTTSTWEIPGDKPKAD